MEKLIEGILLTWRITSLLNAEHGPYEIFDKFRDAVGIEFDEFSQPVLTTELAKMVSCFWCCSIWVGFAVAFFLKKPIWHGFVYSAGAIITHYQVGGYSG